MNRRLQIFLQSLDLMKKCGIEANFVSELDGLDAAYRKKACLELVLRLNSYGENSIKNNKTIRRMFNVVINRKEIPVHVNIADGFLDVDIEGSDVIKIEQVEEYFQATKALYAFLGGD